MAQPKNQSDFEFIRDVLGFQKIEHNDFGKAQDF
ncbi:MAG: hypothetical protein JWQ71_1155 [Pedosphaera sp.]|nr:hypothetical protein [Pedosphaera sp.]